MGGAAMKKIICFHSPDERNGYLSNWYPSAFDMNGVLYSSMEQYMMYQKAVLFGDEACARQILSTDDVGKIKALGRMVQNYDDTLWGGMRQIIVYQGLVEKFRQNEPLKQLLLATNDHILAECAVSDRIWGIGLSMRDDRRLDVSQWQGRNLLGFALMRARDTIREQ